VPSEVVTMHIAISSWLVMVVRDMSGWSLSSDLRTRTTWCQGSANKRRESIHPPSVDLKNEAPTGLAALKKAAGRITESWCNHLLLVGMISGMTTSKIAVSLPTELVAQAQRAVSEGRAPSVSAYVARALQEQAKLDDLAALLEEMLAQTGGPLTGVERKDADRALGR
jgi:Arc/MetJ-type ribon-helix-helix transcriptional regulator